MAILVCPLGDSTSLVSLVQLFKDPFASLLGHPASPLLLKRRFDTLVRCTHTEELTPRRASIMPFHDLARSLPGDVFGYFVEVWRNIQGRIVAVLFLVLCWIKNGLAEDDLMLLGG